MEFTISDTAPGSGPARTRYLEGRIQRVLGPHLARVTDVRLEVTHTADDGLHHALVQLCLDGDLLSFRSAKRRMDAALAEVFEAVDFRLRGGRVRTQDAS